MIKLNITLAALACSFGLFAQTPTQTPTQNQTPSPKLPTAINPAYLAGNCANCHGTQGLAIGAMPSLAGLKASYISEQMHAFRDGKRSATIMHQLAKGYTDAQIDALATYFAAQPTK